MIGKLNASKPQRVIVALKILQSEPPSTVTVAKLAGGADLNYTDFGFAKC
jgi:hypothetical protein